MKKLTTTLITLLMTFLLIESYITPSFASMNDKSQMLNRIFPDIKNHWSENTVKEAIKKGYIDGFEDGNFHPDQTVTRAEFIKMLALALKLDIPKGNEQEWYSPFVNALVHAGIHQWSDFDSGDWNTPITREEVARLSVRATEKEKHNIDTRKWMYDATSTGLITGLNDRGDLGILESSNRAQAVTIIERIFKLRHNENLEVDKHAESQAEFFWHNTNMFTMWKNFLTTKGWNGFNPEGFDSKMTIDSPDGIYKGRITGIYVIDLADTNDPFWSIIPYSINDLYWNAGDRAQFPIRDIKDAFLVYYTQSLDYNNDPGHISTNLYYNTDGSIQLQMLGVGEENKKEFEDGTCCKYDVEQYNRIGQGSLEASQSINLKLDPSYNGKVYQGYIDHKVARLPMMIVPKKIKEYSYVTVDAEVSRSFSQPYTNRLYYKWFTDDHLNTSTKRIELN
ncbi:S-layer homology domain-containing protein [Paenibacillus aestuarii]|uniref:S-layer homology domain-containing protein n=1 Tax=Paenibacillus aestuarii TaxID=516965 RepID=A0ABW0K6M3_9BACL|nr:S-layer homology domain-containing protein [Paenibacillus aestuarii]